MRVYARNPIQTKDGTWLHPSRLTLHTARNQVIPGGPHANTEGSRWASPPAMPSFAHDFSRVPVYSRPQVSLQAKLTVNTLGDIYEQEADRVAEQVTSAPEPQLQRACTCGIGCSKCQHERTAHERLQAKRVQTNHSGAILAPPIVHEVLNSPGQPLETTTQGFMKSRFGHDFSRVRVHTDARAAESARAVSALAYTVGHNIVFGAGQFAPRTSEGRKLLAHELTHVLQNSQSVLQRQTPLTSPRVKPEEEGQSLIFDVFNVGVGTVNNQTLKTFAACASVGKNTPKLSAKLGPGKWGGNNPAKGPKGEKLKDIDFIFPSKETPINGQIAGMFKIGFNDATISPDPENPKNSKIDDFSGYIKENPAHKKETCEGF
jgi:uncharacterized protein DUF4157